MAAPIMPIDQAALVLSDGGVGGLLAQTLAAEAPPGGDASVTSVVLPAMYLSRGDDADRALMIEAAREQGQSLDLPVLEALAVPPTNDERHEAGSSIARHRALELVDAVYRAASLGLRRVVWPVIAQRSEGGSGPDVDDLARILDQAMLAGRLATADLDSGSLEGEHALPDVSVLTPFAELDDDQLADLATDLGIDPSACWWWGGVARSSIAGGRERGRWAGLLGLVPQHGHSSSQLFVD
ncbi:MAG: hypothetical protein AAF356_01755 [Planctomycetota bacterium]